MSNVRVVGSDDVERFAAAVSGAGTGVGFEPELAVVAALRRRAPAYAPDVEARDRAKQRLFGLLLVAGPVAAHAC